ncbi:MAG: RIP metalloprotease RseP [Candidatus Omnitrophota bacterium]
MISTLVFILVISILIVVHEFGHFIAAKKLGVKVERFAVGFGPALFTRKGKDTEYSICAIPLGGYVKMAGDSQEDRKGSPDEYFSQPPGGRFQIIFFGPLLNYVLGFLCFWFIFVAGYPKLTSSVGSVLEGYGAKDAGIMAGDSITAIDGQEIHFWEDLQAIVQRKRSDAKVNLTVLRNGSPKTFLVSIKEKATDDLLGKKHTVGLIGITPSDNTEIVRHGFFESAGFALEKTWDLTVLTYNAIWRMLTGQMSMRESVTGPLGMFYITSKVAQLGIIAIIHFMATISISLCIFNLLPVPVLDGGHIFLLLVEKLKGKPVSAKLERVVTQAGFALLIMLVVVVTYNDIVRLFGEKIAKLFQ